MRLLSDLFGKKRPKSACVIVVKNEEKLISEWIAFHIAVGFSHLFVYNNNSSDKTENIVSGLSKKLPVTLIPWRPVGTYYQCEAYDHAARTFGAQYDWMSFQDSDEFFVPSAHGSVTDFLETLSASDAVALNWAMYGSSGHLAEPVGLVIKEYLLRAPDNFAPNAHTKTLIRPRVLRKFVNPHYAEIDGQYTFSDGAPVEWLSPGITTEVRNLDIARINHYFTRSRSDWEKKVARGNPNGERDLAEFDAYDRNEVEDQTALRWLPSVMRLLSN